MGEYGVRICNIEAATLYEYNLGLRDRYLYKKAMLTNSLLTDFLEDNGLKIYGKESTRDVVCFEFNFGTRSYEEQYKHLRKLSKEAKRNNDRDKRIKILQLRKDSFKKRRQFVKRSKEEIRDIFYRDGISVTYTSFTKKGDIKTQQVVKYKMLYRSTGKAKKGSCMFIREGLYKRTYDFLTMGIKFPKKNTPIVELSAYMPLVSSTIIDKVKINPNNILILKDIDSFFKTRVVSVDTDCNKQCYANTLENYELKNTMFDGQALIDSSIFPQNANGYILLRHHFCKMATFNTNLQMFFKDYYGSNYENATVDDMFGNTHYVKDIELITTDNAMKWLKFDISYEYWCDRVFENDCQFGIVKTAHKSDMGDVQKMSYQMVNTLNPDTMGGVVVESVDYIEQLKKNDSVFIEYLKRDNNYSNDYMALVELVEHNPEFAQSEYFRNRKSRIIRNLIDNFKRGKIIQKADNLTMVGSPYAMLLYAVGEKVENDDSFECEIDSIQCFTNYFDNNEFLAGFRSPHNSCNNILSLHNVYSDKMTKYFNLGDLVVAVNVQHTDIQDRANGCDFDSDSIYCTNQPQIVNHAKECYKNYPTIVNNIPKEKKSYQNTMNCYSEIDNNISSSRMTIGESSNLAQISLTYSYNFGDDKYKNYVCILSVLAQVAIDNAKRRYDIDLDKEIKRIKKDMDIKHNGYPKFWKMIRSGFPRHKINHELNCPMNYLGMVKIREFKPNTDTLPMDYFFNKFELREDRRKCKKVEKFIEKYSQQLFYYNVKGDNKLDKRDDYLLNKFDFDLMIEDINAIYISRNYLGLMSWLIDRAFCITDKVVNNMSALKSYTDKNKSILIKTLYRINKESLFKVFNKNMGEN